MMVMEHVDIGDGVGGDDRVDVQITTTTPISFSDLYEREFLPLVRLATLMTGRVEVARDIVQDAFVRLHVRWSQVRDPLPYIRRSVVNGCASHHRREGKRRGRRDPGEDSVPLDVDHTLSTLAVLNRRERAVVVLKYYEQRNEREIAHLVGCRPGSVGPTVQRALAKLREVQS